MRILQDMVRIPSLALVVLFAVAACKPSRDPVPEPGVPPESAPPTVMIAAPPPEPPPAPPLAEPPPEPALPEPPPVVAAPPAPAGPAASSGSTWWRAMFRDARTVRLGPRAQPLVVTDLQALESLFASMAKTASDRPGLMRRLADTYVELEAGAEQAAPQAAPHMAARLAKITLAARSAATKYYHLLWSQYPGFCAAAGPGRSLGRGCADEVLYYGGYERELAGDLDGARKSYLDLLQGFPHSRLVPLAYLAFGEMFFEEAQREPSKLSLAEQSYEEVLKYPTDIQGYVQYQLGRVLALRGDRVRARSTLKLALLWAQSHQGTPGAASLAAAARHEQP